jgi:hypothetical protein
MMEAWFNLVSEAMRGSSDAQEAFKALSSSTSQDEIIRWMGRFMPSNAVGITPPQVEMFSEWVEEWWKMMGVVPRHRYLEVLERNEQLRKRLEEYEKSRRIPGMASQQEQSEQVMNMWGSAMENMLKMQAEWMRNFVPSQQEQSETTPTETGHGSKPADQEK